MFSFLPGHFHQKIQDITMTSVQFSQKPRIFLVKILDNPMQELIPNSLNCTYIHFKLTVRMDLVHAYYSILTYITKNGNNNKQKKWSNIIDQQKIIEGRGGYHKMNTYFYQKFCNYHRKVIYISSVMEYRVFVNRKCK